MKEFIDLFLIWFEKVVVTLCGICIMFMFRQRIFSLANEEGQKIELTHQSDEKYYVFNM